MYSAASITLNRFRRQRDYASSSAIFGTHCIIKAAKSKVRGSGHSLTGIAQSQVKDQTISIFQVLVFALPALVVYNNRQLAVTLHRRNLSHCTLNSADECQPLDGLLAVRPTAPRAQDACINTWALSSGAVLVNKSVS